MITKAIEKAFLLAKQRNWDKTFWAFDIHETIIYPNYSANEIPTEFYPLAKETLQEITKRGDVCLILYTCSPPSEIGKFLEFFKSHNINFQYVNQNPEVPNGAYGCYDTKFYFDVLFEDKTGFDAENDWELILETIRKH